MRNLIVGFLIWIFIVTGIAMSASATTTEPTCTWEWSDNLKLSTALEYRAADNHGRVYFTDPENPRQWMWIRCRY